jgi:transcriptional regulator with XRE-family HTH domain
MSIDPSDSVAQARRELGGRLRQIRTSAGLTGYAVGVATGQHVTRISRVENGVQMPTERNIRDWCVACGAEEQIIDLVATARSVESAYLEWSRQSRAGMRRLGDLHSVATYRRTTTFRIHEPTVLPGIFQSTGYIKRMLGFWYDFLDAPDDTEATIAMKAERTAVALTPQKRIAVVLGEQALRTRRGTPDEHSEQLGHLLSLMRLPFVSVGVIPADARRLAIATIGFWIFDDAAVSLETPTAAIKVTRPQEISLYVDLFDRLQAEAVHGAPVRSLIRQLRAGM